MAVFDHNKGHNKASDGIRRRAPVVRRGVPRREEHEEEAADTIDDNRELPASVAEMNLSLVKKFAPVAHDETPAMEQGESSEPESSPFIVTTSETRDKFAAARRITDFLKWMQKKPVAAEAAVHDSLFDEDRREPNRGLRWGMLAGTFSFIAIGLVLSTVFARLTVVMKPQVDDVALQNITFAFDASVNRTLLAQKVIPAQRLEFPHMVSREFDSTGIQAIATYATGTVRLYNQFSSAPQKLVASTRLITDSGVVYRLPKNVTIPAAAIEEGKIVPRFIDVALTADQAGEGSNLGGPLTLKIPGLKGTAKYDGFYAVADRGFSGGFKGEARVVSKGDLQRAEEVVTKQAFEELGQEIIRKIPSEFTRVDGLREIQMVKVIAPAEGTRGNRFTVSVNAVGRTVVFREDDVLEFLKSLVIKDGAARELVPHSAILKYQVRTADFVKGRADVTLQGNLKTRAVLAESELRDLVRGKKEGSVSEVLKTRSEIAAFSVSLFPPWLWSAPSSSDKIRIVIDRGK